MPQEKTWKSEKYYPSSLATIKCESPLPLVQQCEPIKHADTAYLLLQVALQMTLLLALWLALWLARQSARLPSIHQFGEQRRKDALDAWEKRQVGFTLDEFAKLACLCKISKSGM